MAWKKMTNKEPRKYNGMVGSPDVQTNKNTEQQRGSLWLHVPSDMKN